MKLYLSSYHLGSHPEKMKELVGEDAKAAIILNAADNSDAERRASYVASQVEALDSLGIKGEELDLRDYFNNPATGLDVRLSEYNLVWVVGGNAFLLMRAMKQSGFDKVIVPMVESDRIVYSGFSAGAVVATPTLRGIELVDDKDITPEGYDKAVVWNGLHLVGKSIAPHYKSNHPESEAVDEVVKYFLDNGMDYWTLTDGQALVVNDTTAVLVT